MVLVIGVAFLFGKTGVILLFLFVSFFALREFMSLTYTRRGDHDALATSFFIVLPLQYWFVWSGWYGLYSVFIPVYAFLVLPILSALSGDTMRFLERAAKVQWGLMVCVFCISHVPALLTLDIPGFEGRNLLLIVFLVLVVQSSDVLQYIWGTLLGKHPIAPDVSDETAASRDFARATLATVLPAGRDAEIVHVTLYRVHQRVAATFRLGRTFLVGDAAHINNPLGGMGMNGGIHDAFNLAEKLAAVLRGDQPATELERYERQRRPVALEYVNTTTIANKRNLEMRDAEEQRRWRAELERAMSDRAAERELMLRMSMIASLRKYECA